MIADVVRRVEALDGRSIVAEHRSSGSLHALDIRLERVAGSRPMPSETVEPDRMSRMAEHGSIFGAMLQEFDGAARILNLDPGIWKILTHPKRQIIVSCPVQMDNGEIEVFTGYRVQYNITLGPAKGGIRYHPDVHARRSHGARRVDDLEVRRRAHPVRRRQGRHHLRSRRGCRGASSRR